MRDYFFSRHVIAGKRRLRQSHSAAFSLIELLVVVGIIAAMSVLAVSALTRISTSSGVTVAGGLVVDQLNLARQTAISRNCQVEFRIYQLPDEGVSGSTTPSQYRAMQMYVLDSAKGTASPAGRAVFLPRGVSFFEAASVSTLLTTQSPPYAVSGTTAAVKFVGFDPGSYNYKCFEFNPDGSTDLDPTKNWFISLANTKEKLASGQQLPANFFTVQIDPATGRIRNFRPN
ncbi:MAG: Verru_Chthon cassette protein D [Candidatus Methylacidiphilales bacterium]|nr:Verru_Chthon cassette protein D [Candidatus Methylacidiphilales bacterium]